MLKILVIGIRGETAHELQKLYNGVIKFTFFTDAAKVAKPSRGKYDYILAFWKFTNHSVERNYSDHTGYVRVRSNTQLLGVLVDLTGETLC